MPIPDEDSGFGLMSAYCLAVGAIQVLYASFFGWLAFPCLMWTFEQIHAVVQNGFSLEGRTFKGAYLPAIDMSNLAEGTTLALLAISCLIGGCGLLGLRSWARRWEIAYVILVSGYSAVVFVTESRRGHDLGYIVLAYMILALPYLPLLFIPLPHTVLLVGELTRDKLIVDGLDGIERLTDQAGESLPAPT